MYGPSRYVFGPVHCVRCNWDYSTHSNRDHLLECADDPNINVNLCVAIHQLYCSNVVLINVNTIRQSVRGHDLLTNPFKTIATRYNLYQQVQTVCSTNYEGNYLIIKVKVR